MIKEVFSSGTHTDSAGNTKQWTTQDLLDIANKYNEQSAHEAPVVLGHPTTDGPAYGWVKRLYVEGTKLMAEFKDMANNFTDWMKQGLYKKTSIALYPDKLLRHIGFLGATPPAVKGLKDVEFKSDEQFTTVEFSDGDKEEMNKEFMKKFLAFAAEELGNEVTSKIEKFLYDNDYRKVSTKDDTQPQSEFANSPEYKAMLARTEASERELKEMRFNNMFSDLLTSGKAIPAQKEALKTLYMSVGANQFGEKSGIDILSDLMNSNSQLIEFNELAKKEDVFTEDEDKAIRDAVKEFEGAE